MNKHELKLLLVLAGAARPMYALEIKRAGRYWFLPWQHMPAMADKGWIFPLTTDVKGERDVPPPTYYEITETGRIALAEELNRRAKP